MGAIMCADMQADFKQRPMNESAGEIDGPNGRLAFRSISGAGPAIVWLGGFRSDMNGSKAEAIAQWAAVNGRSFLRFDFSGHGQSDGRFEDGTISSWLEDALAAIGRLTDGRLVLVGSSMGAWIAALVGVRMTARLAGLVLIAPAPDFTEELMWRAMSESERAEILREGRLVKDSAYSGETTIITRTLIEDGRRHLVLGSAIQISCPVRIVQGLADPDVPWRHALRLADRLTSGDLELTLIKGGDHRLSKPHEILRIISAIAAIVEP